MSAVDILTLSTRPLHPFAACESCGMAIAPNRPRYVADSGDGGITPWHWHVACGDKLIAAGKAVLA